MTGFDTNEVQGDVVVGLLKQVECFMFINVDHRPHDFLEALAENARQLITSTAQAQQQRTVSKEFKDNNGGALLPGTAVNIAFTAKGLTALGVDQRGLDSETFTNGQQEDAVKALGDFGDDKDRPVTWEPLYKDNNIHAVWIVTGDSQDSVDKKIKEIVREFQGSFVELGREYGKVRPGKDEKGPLEHREHFGFEDGISFPRIQDFHEDANPNHPAIKASQFILGLDESKSDPVRPAWIKHASYLAFRKLEQHVPEFDKFTKAQAEKEPHMTAEQVGARMVGRWKNGTPLDLNANNNEFSVPKSDEFRFHEDKEQRKCPFAAHIRKMNPRDPVPPIQSRAEDIDIRLIIRHGIPYGGELHKDEKLFEKTLQDRGLLFVCYQANIKEQFAFLQESWANNERFPPVAAFGDYKAGFDPIIGQKGKKDLEAKDFDMQGLVSQAKPGDNNNRTPLKPWVVPRGGEYFISPSISALENKFFSAGKGVQIPTGGKIQQPFEVPKDSETKENPMEQNHSRQQEQRN